MNIIITDCDKTKLLALESVTRHHFGSSFKIITVEKKDFDAPLTFPDLEKTAGQRLSYVSNSFDKTDYKKDTLYYATLQKGFVESYHKNWMLVAYALFRKEKDTWLSGTGEWVAVPPELWPFINLPEKERYDKLYKVCPILKKQPLVTFCTGTEEREWFKRAFNSCIKTLITA